MMREESRELTHEEIWNDSALIDAWNSATAEYEVFHGKTQDWKSTTVKKSSLWYNIPCNSSKVKAKGETFMNGQGSIDFSTLMKSLPAPTISPVTHANRTRERAITTQ
ncbi:uncharacterized protein BJ212DRAFT_1314004 [Suillus subaureus]|uniref:Uncharacterized protein n=1 Tax=Suillus subaureus TaxID=48587 RepID=A0A9P7EM33_9AGAM|nr:uncharacterized protein BJ212DRAFT_1314004 [Suillus subaureus]KAG1825436.1 hypothetical protein BJ212DRAFT_1314004 [Suillus subaureus]